MIKDILNKNEKMTPNSKEIAILKEHFPSCFKSDGTFDIEKFKGFLSDKITVTDEGYELKFLGKNYARLLASVDTTTVITPNEEHNSKPENKNSENIYISGDNLDGLKHLLKSYSGQIKCIYIDPPYNTGTDGFVYNDNFDFTVDSLSEKLSISEEQAERILDLTKRGSASHSAWLMFMYPRLILARDLLSEDGVIFISIDDNEQANLKLICDDVFGEEHFIGQITVETANGVFGTRASGLNTTLVKVKDYVLSYTKSKKEKNFLPLYMPTNERFDTHYSIMIDENLNRSSFVDYLNKSDELKGYFEKYKMSVSLKNISKIMEIDKNFNDIIINRLSDKIYQDVAFSLNVPQDIEEKLSSGNLIEWKEYLIFKTRNGKGSIRQLIPFKKSLRNTDDYISEYRRAVAIGDLWEGFDNDMKNVSNEGISCFDTPKPVRLIKQLIKWCNIKKDDTVLDFFSGSATTAHAVMNLNAEDGGNRKFIMVQLPEIIEEGKPAYEAGYRTIDQIGMDRIIKAANKIKEENPDLEADLGFKHFILQEPTPNTLDKIEEFDPNENKLFADKTLLDEFGKPTILSTWLVRDGYGLTAQPEELDLSGYKGYFIDKHLYLIDTEIPNEAIEKIVVKYETDGSFNPENIVLFGYSFTWTQMEQLKINLKRLKDTEKNLNINFDVRY
jgi:adenine-specific DNA-methyltransferase